MPALSAGLSDLDTDRVSTFLLSSSAWITGLTPIENLSFTMYPVKYLFPAVSCTQDCFVGGPQR
jgi:hypothetical protein